MKILKLGKIPETSTYQATCNHCATQIEFTQNEGNVVRVQHGSDYLEVVCPVCAYKITVYPSLAL